MAARKGRKPAGRRKRKAAKKPKLGSGKRFAALEKSIARKGNVSNPGAVAAAIGRKKYGNQRMQKMAATGRRRAARARKRGRK